MTHRCWGIYINLSYSELMTRLALLTWQVRRCSKRGERGIDKREAGNELAGDYSGE